MTSKKKVMKKKNNILKDLSKNNWAISTILLSILLLAALAFTFYGNTCDTTIDTDEAGQKVVEFLSSQGTQAELISVEEFNGLYEVVLTANGQEGALYITKDGNNLIPQPIPLTANVIQDTPRQSVQDDVPKIPIYECIEQYGISSETIIFYYSDSCGWCAKMKPGVEALEKEGYNFKWIEGSNTEDSQIIDECIRAHMGSGGVPQFICPKTSEIYVGAFTDENREMDKEALKTWVDNCIAS